MRGSSLLDALIASALFAVMFTAMLALGQLALRTVAEHKMRAGAAALAGEQMEYIRSLNYASVGVQGGSPSGVVQSPAIKMLNGTSYTLTTTIGWTDDASDGLAPSDPRPNDYKRVRVRASWQQGARTDEVVLSSLVASFLIE